jgi:hypothetical protein
MTNKSGGGKPPPKPPQRHTTPKEATLASGVLSGRVKPTPAQSRSLAASVLSQDAPKRKK